MRSMAGVEWSGRVLRRQVRNHLKDIGSTAASAVPGGRGRPAGYVAETPGALADAALDRPVLNVVAAADGFQAANRRMLIITTVHDIEANTFNLLLLPCTMRASPGGIL